MKRHRVLHVLVVVGLGLTACGGDAPTGATAETAPDGGRASTTISEPRSISYDDAHFVAIMRDGYPLSGRRDMDGSLPALDSFGGHTSATPDSATPTYHYHINKQTSTNATSLGQERWFLTTGTYRGAPGTCAGC